LPDGVKTMRGFVSVIWNVLKRAPSLRGVFGR